ncbi:cytochrome P450 [Streptosporangium becharense]|uniref:cytochrome P450 family protein n=1 Tax=Streptosporangium becharense TaxID=1816182 RepID=UPI001618DEAD|nr:cytochrome P450 [Streptosporangium becharense]MBB2910700.1 cytochrome P450 [Streptosporangium becharense]
MQFPGVRVWLVTRYEDVRALYNDPRMSVNQETANTDFHTAGMAYGAGTEMGHSLLFKDPPDHTRMRTLASKVFSARRIAGWRDTVERITDQLLDDVAPHQRVDLLGVFCYPLPIMVIGEVLGIPGNDHRKLRQWMDPLVGLSREEALAGTKSLMAYVREIITVKRADPSDDVISALIAARDGDRKLTEDELVGNVFGLISAGFETTANLIGNGVLALLDHPDQLRLLRENPPLMDSAMEEILRYDGPTATTIFRFPTEDVRVGGVVIPAGEPILMALGAANRDPEVFDDPDALDIRRGDNAHISFGRGIHHCLGAALARLEGKTALRTLLRRYPDISLAVSRQQIRYKPAVIVRGLEELPVVLQPSR